MDFHSSYVYRYLTAMKLLRLPVTELTVTIDAFSIDKKTEDGTDNIYIITAVLLGARYI